jgi:hypothetical protein
MSGHWGQMALAYRPAPGYRNPPPNSPPPAPDYSLAGFIFNIDEPSERLRRRLENPRFDFCVVPTNRTATIQNTVILLFRTLNFFADFKDMTEFMYAMADALGWDIDDCRAIVRRYVRAREAYLNVRNLDRSRNGPDAQNESEKGKLICDLVDEYIANKPRYRTMPQSRHDFFDEARASWKDILKDSSILNPTWTIPGPRTTLGADWSAARYRSLDIGLNELRARSPRPEREAGSRGRSPISPYGQRRNRRSISPQSDSHRRRSTIRLWSPIRYRSPLEFSPPRRTWSTIQQRFPDRRRPSRRRSSRRRRSSHRPGPTQQPFRGDHWSPPRQPRQRARVRHGLRRRSPAPDRSPGPRVPSSTRVASQDFNHHPDTSMAADDDASMEDVEQGMADLYYTSRDSCH